MSSPDLLSRVADRWQDQVARQKEYEVVRDGNIFGYRMASSSVMQSEYTRAIALREFLLGEYAACSVDDLFPGEEIDTSKGPCYAISSLTELCLPQIDPMQVREDICSDLTLIYGIGPRTARKLNERGYRNITDLLDHPHYRGKARSFLEMLDRGDGNDLLGWMRRWYPASHCSVLKSSLLQDCGSFTFLDIETLGLFSRPVILFGIGRLDGADLSITQYLVREIEEEEAALAATFETLINHSSALITFNGRSFDLPYLLDRAAYYGWARQLRIPHYDVLHFSRSRWRDMLPDCRLQTIEQMIGEDCRGNDLPGALVPEFYETYLKTGNAGMLKPIIEHNRLDIITLARIYARLLEEL